MKSTAFRTLVAIGLIAGLALTLGAGIRWSAVFDISLF